MGTVVTALCIFSCAPSGKFLASNVNDAGSLSGNSFFYALPQTVVDIMVTAQATVIIPGPYYQYAEKYLGIVNAPAKPETSWKITQMSLQTHHEVDPDYIYGVKNLHRVNDYPEIIRLLEDSLIISYANLKSDLIFYNTYPVASRDIYYTDLSVKRNFEAEKDISVSLIMPDSEESAGAKRKPSLKEKSVEQKAEEAANFLIKIRKRRFKLVSGQYDYMPEGVAMTESLKELNRLEEEYLSLFIGKRMTYPCQRTYHYSPLMDKESDRVVLFRFLESDGFVDYREAKGSPVLLEITNNNQTKGIKQAKQPQKSTDNVIYFRISDQVNVKVIYGEMVMIDAMLPIFQSGVIVPLRIDKPDN
jgi:hypothetical protein